MVLGTEADFDGSATLVAVSSTVAGVGKICGAVKTPVLEMVPQALPEQPEPLSVQVTAVLGLPAEAMLAVKVCCAPSSTGALVGAMETLTSLAMVTCAEPVAMRQWWPARGLYTGSVAGDGHHRRRGEDASCGDVTDCGIAAGHAGDAPVHAGTGAGDGGGERHRIAKQHRGRLRRDVDSGRTRSTRAARCGDGRGGAAAGQRRGQRRREPPQRRAIRAPHWAAPGVRPARGLGAR